MALNEIAERKAQKAVKGNAFEIAVTILMEAYGDDIFRFCNSMLNNNADAQDVLQIVFVQAHRGLGSFQGKSSYCTWLYVIARNRCLDHLKQNKRLHKRVNFVDVLPERESQPDESQPNPSDPFLNEVLRKCLSMLSNGVRAAILLRFQSGHSYAEAAPILEEKAGTLQARVARALPALRRCLEENGVAP